MPTKFEKFIRSKKGLPLILIICSFIFGLIFGFVNIFLLRGSEYPFYTILLMSLMQGVWYSVFSIFSVFEFFLLPAGLINFFTDINITSDTKIFWYLVIFLANLPYWGFIIYTYLQRNKFKKWLLYILYLLICIIYLLSLKGFIDAIDFL